MTDITSCQLQQGEWDSTYQECNSKIGKMTCADFTNSALAYGLDYGKRGCVDTIGCSWTNDDGSVERNAYLGGECFGTAVKCSALDETRCNAQLGCKYSSAAPKGCDPANSRDPLANYTACDEYTPTSNPADARAHPTALHGSCLAKIGCSYRLAGGTVEPGKQ